MRGSHDSLNNLFPACFFEEDDDGVEEEDGVEELEEEEGEPDAHSSIAISLSKVEL
jgi:hypothetical protein